MEELFRKHPLAIVAAIGAMLLASWFSDSWFWIIAFTIVGAIAGIVLDSNKE